MGLAETIFENPALLAGLAAVVLAAVRYQRGLSWFEYRRIHGLKVLLFPILDRRTNVGVSLVNAKLRAEDDDEFLGVAGISPRQVAKLLVAAGGSYHLVNSIKSRPDDEGGSEYSVAHVVFFHDDGTQTEVYLFRSDSGTDVYAHHETAVTDPDGHIMETQQVDGDPRGVVDDSEVVLGATA